jgi:hypothetical protein
MANRTPLLLSFVSFDTGITDAAIGQDRMDFSKTTFIFAENDGAFILNELQRMHSACGTMKSPLLIPLNRIVMLNAKINLYLIMFGLYSSMLVFLCSCGLKLPTTLFTLKTATPLKHLPTLDQWDWSRTIDSRLRG